MSEQLTAGRRQRARRGQGDRLRAEIVDAASRMLGESGEVGELSLRAVAREVGVAATSIYLHFRSMEELVKEVKLRYFEDFGAVLQAASEAAGEVPRDRVRASVHAYVRYGLEHPGEYAVMFSSEMLPSHLLSDSHFIGQDLFEAFSGQVATAVGPDQDASMLATHIWTALHGIVTLRAARRRFPWPDLDRQLDDLVDRLLAG
jgi:AcrR family transcriptional regulator